ncbi:MAG: phage tail tape measure protein [Paracoccaceae bacterium]|jgi:phage-related minor tail protein|nr:phage tail tape measure protein [Paracoccaceae bacterium]MDP5344775.1 phage tail tape measure protein [Paracoccaceae bacterium]
MANVDELSDQITRLEESLQGAQAMAGAFQGELDRMRQGMAFTSREVGSLTTSIGGGLRRAFDGLVFDGMKLSDALKSVARSMVDNVYSTAMKPVQNALGGFVANGLNSAMSGLLPFAKGGSFAQGRVLPFAAGGVVTGPTSFAMRGGQRGLMGEAGPEAIMPLTRGADGRLGVRNSGGGGQPVSVVMHVSTPDVQGFQRSQSQISAELARLLTRGQRNR